MKSDQIIKIEQFSVEDLINKVRKVPMLKAPEVFPYVDEITTLIKYKIVDVENLTPAQRYVLQPNLDRIQEIGWQLKEKFDVDIYNLNGYVRMYMENGEEIDLLPPIIEGSTEKNGTEYRIINDGMHRCMSAYLESTPCGVVEIFGVPEEYPYYAFPLVDGWLDVEVLKELKPGFVKKRHRIRDHKTLFRNFNAQFNAKSEPRGDGSK